MEITAAKIKRAIREPSYLAEVGKRRVENLNAFRERHTEIAAPPKSITLFLTSICNLRCRMCAQYGESGTSLGIPKEVPPTDVVLRAIEELAPYGTRFTLMGGEPTLNPDWFKIVQAIKSHGLSCEIITNGTMLSRNADRFVESGIDQVNLSCDGLGEANDQIRGKGVFAKIEEGLDRLIEARKDNGSEHPSITILHTINRPNYTQLVKFAEWAATKEVRAVIYQHLRFYSENDFRNNSEFMLEHFDQDTELQSGFVFEPGEFDTEVLFEQIRTLKSREWPFYLGFQPDHPLEELDDYYHDPNYKRRDVYDCSVPWEGAAIDPSCQVIPCMDYICGDLREESFMDIWNGERYRKFRATIREHGRTPICHRCCI